MECPHCGGIIPDGIEYCNVCYYAFSKKAVAINTPEADVSLPDPLATSAGAPPPQHLPQPKVQTPDPLVTHPEAVTPSTPPEPGTIASGEVIVGRFEVLRMLGKGGMGAVYLCRDRQLERQIAIKVLLSNLASEEWGIKRFLTEARAVASINHPNVIQVHDVLEDATGNYIVMEFLEGATLAARLQNEGALSVREVTRIALQIGMALTVAHKTGVIHRDIKPENIMFTASGSPKLGDFGIAQLFGQIDLTHTGTAMGTWVYASPEQLVDAKRVDQRSDIYSLGATMYEMLTGEMPRHIDLDKIPKFIQPVLKKCLARAPEDRYQSAAEFVKSLAEAYNKAQPTLAQGVEKKDTTETTGATAMTPSEPSTAAKIVVSEKGHRREKILWHARGVLWANPFPFCIGLALLGWLLIATNPNALQAQIERWLYDLLEWAAYYKTITIVKDNFGLLDTLVNWLKLLPFYWTGLGLSTVMAVIPALRNFLTKFRLSSSRLTIKGGIILRREHVLHLDQIQDVHASQGIPGMVLGYGKLSLVCWNGDAIVLEGVPHPSNVVHKITSAMRDKDE